MLIILICKACKNEFAPHTAKEISFELINTKNTFTAGESIEIQFTGSTTSSPNLWITNAFGSTVIKPTTEDNQLTFSLPKTFTEKSGVCTWRLVQNKNSYANGKITVVPHWKRNAQIE